MGTMPYLSCAFAVLVPGIPGEEAISPDRDDDFVLACAIDHKVD